MNTFLLRATAFCIAIIAGFQPVFGQITYVSPGATGDGSSWGNATGDLKSVLDTASFGDVVWVEQGTYYPETCINCTPIDMNQSFEINDGVKVYGGFQGWESTIEERDWEANLTILSGDLNQDNQPDSNAYSVVYFENVTSATILDGFTISDANANSLTGSNSNRMKSGGGIYNLGTTTSNPILRNLIVKNNYAVSGGGGMVNNGSSNGEASPRIENCQFLNNECGQNGGAIFNDASTNGLSSPEIINVVFQNNVGKYGAGVYNSALTGTSSPSIVNCSFISNTAINYAGAIYNFGKSGGTTDPIIFNCLFYKNTASSAGAVYSLGSVGTATPDIANCTFFGNHANTGGAVYCNESVGGLTQATIYNSIFWSNTAGFDPMFHLSGNGTPKMVLSHSLVDEANCDDIIAFLGPLDTLICDGGMIYNEYPMFVDTASINFRLANSSPAINQGDNDIVNSNDILLDMDNHIRIHNGSVDMGIYEYGSQPYQAPVIVGQPSSQTVCEYDDPVLSVTIEGSEPLDYQWSKNGIDISGATESNYNISNADTGDIGDYACRVISIFADTVYSNVASLDVSSSVDPYIEITANLTSICEGDHVTFNATIMNGGVSPVYEWKINGQIEFTGGDTFVYSSFEDGDEVNCRLTSSELCASPTTITSSSIEIDVTPVVTPSINISTSTTQICSGETLVFTANSENEGTSPTYEWKVNGTVVYTGSETYAVNNLVDGDAVSCVLYSSELCAAPMSATSSEINISVSNVAQPSISISASTNQICSGEVVTFNASETNGGLSPTYTWFLNGQPTGTNSSIFSSSSLMDNDVVTCELSSSLSCANPSVVNSNNIEIEVIALVQPAITISSSLTEICDGETISFEATSVNTGDNPVYQWTVNGMSVGSNSPNFESNSLIDGALVTCVVNSSAVCASPSTASSNSISIEVTTLVEPTIEIVPSITETCSGQPVTFTATTANAGANPIFEWFVDGQSVGANNSTFTSSNLMDGVEVTCQLNSSMLCASPGLVVSNVVSPTIIATVQPTVFVEASSLNVCSGETITFTANTTNEGLTPTYQWMVNNQPVGGNSSSFSSATLSDGSEVYCEITSSASCASPAIVSSDLVAIQITNTVQPAIQISANASEICAGEFVTFTAIGVNEGNEPVYEWRMNGVVVGSNSPVFSTSDLIDGTSVYCTLTSSSDCTTEVNVSSNTIELEVADLIEPEIVVTSSANTFCLGDTAIFTATAINGGVTPAYEWRVNGEVIPEASLIFSSTDLENGTLVECQLTSSSNCASPTIVLSNTVEVVVIDNVNPTISINADVLEICSGELITFESTSVFGGANPSYDWLVNGVSTGIDNATFSSDLLTNHDTIICLMSSSESCANSDVVSSEPVVVTVNPNLLLNIELEASDTAICYGDTVTFTANSENQGSSPIYQWLVNESFVNGNGNEFVSGDLTDGDSVSCVLVSSEFCVLNNNIQSPPILMSVDSCLVAVFDEQMASSEIALFPNPTTGLFSIKYEGQSEYFELQIQDAQGRILRKENFSSFDTSFFDISSFNSGIYFIKIIGLHNSYNFKIILEK